jgi:predicted GIY-YIG superfamily endonuclease
MKCFWTYIMSNKSRRLYTGFTSDIIARVIRDKRKLYPNSFTARYCFDMLVWYREKKLSLILTENPDWADLSSEWMKIPVGSSNQRRAQESSRKRLALRAAEPIPQPHAKILEDHGCRSVFGFGMARG